MDLLLWIAEHPLVLLGAVLGPVFASFLVVVGERVPAGGSVDGRSVCVCGEQLRGWRPGHGPENVPVLGWLWRGGRTHCGERLPVFYLVAEVGLAVVWAVAGIAGPVVAAVSWLVAGAALVAVTAVRTKRSARG